MFLRRLMNWYTLRTLQNATIMNGEDTSLYSATTVHFPLGRNRPKVYDTQYSNRNIIYVFLHPPSQRGSYKTVGQDFAIMMTVVSAPAADMYLLFIHNICVSVFVCKCVCVCVCVHCIRNSHTYSRPVEHQPSSFTMIYIYTDPNISSPSSVRFPTGANICSPISKRDHDPRPNPTPPHIGAFTPHCCRSRRRSTI